MRLILLILFLVHLPLVASQRPQIGEPVACGYDDFPPCEANHANPVEDLATQDSISSPA